VTVSGSCQVNLVFNVTNNTPYTWCDYHFIFSNDVNLTAWTSSVFQNSAYDANTLSLNFWEPDWVSECQNVSFILTLNPAEDFVIDQVATTVPIPGAIWLLGSGLFGILRFKKR
jgi:hypothetical protein